jgi:hypothetical protein
MRYASFVVRLWLPEADLTADQPALRGRIEHVQTGAVGRLSNLEDVSAFIRRHILKETSEQRQQEP